VEIQKIPEQRISGWRKKKGEKGTVSRGTQGGKLGNQIRSAKFQEPERMTREGQFQNLAAGKRKEGGVQWRSGYGLNSLGLNSGRTKRGGKGGGNGRNLLRIDRHTEKKGGTQTKKMIGNTE